MSDSDRSIRLQGDAETDVVVVGGGFAGVSAARELDRAGVPVLLLEARDRLGGRAMNAEIGGGVIGSLGAQAASSHHSHMLELAREVGAETFPLPYDGKGVFVQDDQRMEVEIPNPAMPQPQWQPLFAALRTWDELAKEIDPDRPWESPHAWEWDAQTAITWIAANVQDPFTQGALAAMVGAANAPPQKTSLLAMLHYGRANEVGWAADHTFIRGWQRCSQGWQTVAERVGDRLGRGKKVYTSSRVREIRQDDQGVSVRGDGFRVRAKRVIVAMPPHLMGRLDYDPPLSAARQALSQRVPLEGGYQALAVYDEPFWFKEGLTGISVSATLPVPGTLDDSPKDHSCGILLCLTNQLENEKLRTATPEESRELHLQSLEKYFGPKARKPEAFYFKDWDTDPLTGGCIPYFTTGTLTSCGMALRQAHGRVHFASTEQSSRYWVHMNGAVHSGKETAKQVLDRL